MEHAYLLLNLTCYYCYYKTIPLFLTTLENGVQEIDRSPVNVVYKVPRCIDVLVYGLQNLLQREAKRK